MSEQIPPQDPTPEEMDAANEAAKAELAKQFPPTPGAIVAAKGMNGISDKPDEAVAEVQSEPADPTPFERSDMSYMEYLKQGGERGQLVREEIGLDLPAVWEDSKQRKELNDKIVAAESRERDAIKTEAPVQQLATIRKHLYKLEERVPEWTVREEGLFRVYDQILTDNPRLVPAAYVDALAHYVELEIKDGVSIGEIKKRHLPVPAPNISSREVTRIEGWLSAMHQPPERTAKVWEGIIDIFGRPRRRGQNIQAELASLKEAMSRDMFPSALARRAA